MILADIEAIEKDLPAGVTMRLTESVAPERGTWCVTIRSSVDAWEDWCGPTPADVRSKVKTLLKHLKLS